MKRYLLAALLLVGIVNTAQAQSLDIGGVELQLGERADKVRDSLSSYQVRVISESEWMVTRKVGEQYHVLGTVNVGHGIANAIYKYFAIGDNKNTSAVYTRAYEELRRRGGTNCRTRVDKLDDGTVRAFVTQCGPYQLRYNIPFINAKGRHIPETISIYIHRE